jgi:ribosomal protein S18 acetylase RimI-like enzyme
MIRIARLEDMDKILLIVKETIEDLQIEGNYQWDETYPTNLDFESDIKQASLYIYELEGDVAGFICINRNESEAYQGLPWRSKGDAVVIHRFAVKRPYQRQQIGTKLVEYAERFTKNKGINYLKVDTNSKNTRMNALFKKLDYQYIGTIQLRNVEAEFNCYDKILE